jgi:hypothetical protein
MTERESLDNLIRLTIREEITRQEPSPSIRGKLLAEAAHNCAWRSAVGPSMPPVVNGLTEDVEDEQLSTTDIPTLMLGGRQWFLLTAPFYAVR